jgi:hypothetical protein
MLVQSTPWFVKWLRMGRNLPSLSDPRSSGLLDTLAAASAEAGDFANAVKWQKQALQLIDKMDRGDYQSRLELYKAHKPYREVPTSRPGI